MTRSRRGGWTAAGRRTGWLIGATAAAAVVIVAAVVLVGDSDSPQGVPSVGAQRGERAPEVALPTAGGDDIVLGGRSPGLIVASFLAPG